MEPEQLLGGFLLLAAVVYALTGGADFGGGVWDLLARGPRAARQRALIERAIAPIWEANHVWLIAIVVVLFGAFPPAYAAVSVALHIPLTLLLLGIVARGAAFVFRAYDSREDQVQRRWGWVFSVSSTVTPILLGVVVGSLGTGGIEMRGGRVVSGFFTPWTDNAFPWAVGALALALFAFLAAVYLTVEARENAENEDDELADDFRARAMGAAGVAAVAAVATYALAADSAPVLFAELTSLGLSGGLFALTALCATASVVALHRRRYRLARATAQAQVAFVIVGWGVAQSPWLLVDALTLQRAAAPTEVLWYLVWGLGIGLVPLLAGLYYLFRVFKGARADAPRDP